MVRTGRGCHTILLVPGNNLLMSLLGTGALGDFRTLVLEMRRMRPRRLRRKGVILGSAVLWAAFGQQLLLSADVAAIGSTPQPLGAPRGVTDAVGFAAQNKR